MKFIAMCCLSLTAFTTAASSVEASQLQSDRENVIKQYIMDLQQADVLDITGLFENNGTVVSTSRGKVLAQDFFSGFLPEIQSASTEIHQIFSNNTDKNRYAARFHFVFKLKDGEAGEGEYVDEFTFTNNSPKLTAVYMFENIKFDGLE
jgi:hypothetical protein